MNDAVRGLSAVASDNWGLNDIVRELRQVRIEARVSRGQRAAAAIELPSRETLQVIVHELICVLFPRRLGSASLRDDNEDFFVGHKLDFALNSRHKQVRLELDYFSASALDTQPSQRQANEWRARDIVRRFAATLPQIRRLLDSDLLAGYQGDPAATSLGEVLLCYPGMIAIMHHRFAHELYQSGVGLVARLIAEIAHSETGIDIHPGAHIGGGFFIDHGTGVVIGETAIIGERVRLYQAVTLGAKRFPVTASGELQKGIPRHPLIEDDVVIYAGATILGRITVGRGSTIGGNVWLTRSVPPGSNVTQADVLNEVQSDGSGI